MLGRKVLWRCCLWVAPAGVMVHLPHYCHLSFCISRLAPLLEAGAVSDLWTFAVS